MSGFESQRENYSSGQSMASEKLGLSRDVVMVLGAAAQIARILGQPQQDTSHLLAAIAWHAEGNAVLGGQVKKVLRLVCGHHRIPKLLSVDEPARPNCRPDLVELVRCVVADVKADPARFVNCAAQLSDLVRQISRMPESAAHRMLRENGLVAVLDADTTHERVQ